LSTKSNFNKNQKETRDDFEVPFEELKNLQWLGSGAQGVVFKGTFNNEEVAIKKVKSKEEANLKHLKKLNHPNLVKFKGVSFNGEKVFCIIMEFCPFGQLYSYLSSKESTLLKPDQILDWSKQIANGMNYLHQNKIIHRDLKSPK
jgi:mitogen-activated protein kinase kinase kinase 13